MLFPRLLTQHTSEAMHVQGNDGQSNTSGKSLPTFRPNTVEATVFKIVDGRLHSGVLTAHSSKRFTLFAFPISLALQGSQRNLTKAANVPVIFARAGQ